jgi:hypothetical protein
VRRRLALCALVAATLAFGSLAEANTTTLARVSQAQWWLSAGTQVRALPSALVSRLSSEDASMFRANPCAQTPAAAPVARACTFGDPHGALSVVLFGDSHAQQWIGALDALGRAGGFRVIAYVRLGCVIANLPLRSYVGTLDAGCATFRQRVIAAINALRPAPSLVLLAQFHDNPPRTPSGSPVSDATFDAALTNSLNQIHVHAARVLLAGEPVANWDPSTCLAVHLSDVRRCAHVVSATERARQIADGDAARRAGVAVGWVNDLLCASSCPLVANSLLVHAQWEHVSAPYALAVAGGLGEVLGCASFAQPSSLVGPGSVLWRLNGGNGTPARKADCSALRP